MRKKLNVPLLIVGLLSVAFLYNAEFVSELHNGHSISKPHALKLEAESDQFQQEEKSITIKKRYSSSRDVPLHVEYTEYNDGYWWAGILKQVGPIEKDSITEHWVAAFEGKIYSRLDFPDSEVQQFKYDSTQFEPGGKEITIKKRYISKDDVPLSVDYSEYNDDCWWSGILVKASSVTTDPITGHWEAAFEGKIYKR